MPLPTNMPSPLPSITSTPSPSSSVFAPLTPYYMPASPPASGVWPSTGVSVPGLPSSMPYIRPQEKKNKRSYVSSQEYFGGTEQKFDENAYWSQFPIPKISKKFTPKQRSKIWQALLIAQERMQSEQVLDCIDKRVTTKEYDDETSREAVRRFITNAQLSLVEDPAILPGKNRRQYLYIEDKPFSFHKRSSYNGWAKIGYSRFIEKRDLTINLNSIAIPKHDADGWAGIIVHEIMHLHSYDHKDYDIKINHYEQFKGNLTYETGWCVSSKGDEQEYASRSNSSILLTAPNNLPLDPDLRPLEENSDFPQDSLRNLED
jgi:hypothetical protein